MALADLTAIDYTWTEAPGPSSRYVRPAIEREVASGPSGPILDIGCGNGFIASSLIAKGYDVHGIDGSESGIAHASTLNPGRFERVRFEDLAQWADRQKPFSIVISTEVIEHVYSPLQFVVAIRKLLVPGGRVVLSTPYHGYLKNLAISLVNGWDHHWNPLWEGGHIKFWSPSTLAQLLRSQGFSDIRWYGVGRVPLLWKSMIVVATG